jgi:predicted glycoside hydrolase/deacetylase ChbG (UPF0249 family)
MKLILHADDFGMNPAVSDGIIAAFSEGLLTSTSLLCNAPAAAQAVEAWKTLEYRRVAGALSSMERRRSLDDPDRPFDLGVHLNLTQGRPLTAAYPAELRDANGFFAGIFTLYRCLLRGGSRFKPLLERELDAQIQFLESLRQRPTHVNGHQYCEMLPTVCEIVPPLLKKHGIGMVRTAVEWHWQNSLFWQRLRPASWLLGGLKQIYARRFLARARHAGLASPQAFFGTMLAGEIDLPRVTAFLDKSRNMESAEIGLHPALESPTNEGEGFAHESWRDPLAEARPRELAMLTSNELYETLLARKIDLSRLNRE